MAIGNRHPMNMNKALAQVLALMTLLLSACGDSLNSQDGPSVGLVTGLVCQDVATLSAVASVPAAQGNFINEGKCLNLRASRVNFLRTVTMPGEGQYSQFEYDADGKRRKFWIRTALVRPV